MSRLCCSNCVAAMLILGCGMLARADVTAVSLSESVQTSVVVPDPFGGSDSDSLSSTSFPPVTLSVTSSAGVSSNFTSATATITITGYSGPMAVGDSTPGLTLSGSTVGFNGQGISAGAVLSYFFDLDQAHPFTYTGTGGSQQLFFTRIGGPFISPGSSGTLLAGSYQFIAGPFPSTFNLTITPEPSILSLLAPAGACLMRVRTRGGRLTC